MGKAKFDCYYPLQSNQTKLQDRKMHDLGKKHDGNNKNLKITGLKAEQSPVPFVSEPFSRVNNSKIPILVIKCEESTHKALETYLETRSAAAEIFSPIEI